MVAVAVCFAVPACPKINPFMENILTYLRTVVLLVKVWRLQNLATRTSNKQTYSETWLDHTYCVFCRSRRGSAETSAGSRTQEKHVLVTFPYSDILNISGTSLPRSLYRLPLLVSPPRQKEILLFYPCSSTRDTCSLEKDHHSRIFSPGELCSDRRTPVGSSLRRFTTQGF